MGWGWRFNGKSFVLSLDSTPSFSDLEELKRQIIRTIYVTIVPSPQTTKDGENKLSVKASFEKPSLGVPPTLRYADHTASTYEFEVYILSTAPTRTQLHHIMQFLIAELSRRNQ